MQRSRIGFSSSTTRMRIGLWSPALALVTPKLVFDRVHERARRLDDVVGDTHRAPGLLAVARGDEDARLGSRPLRLVEDPDPVVDQADRLEGRVELVERLAQGVVEGVHGAAAGRGRVLEVAPHAE